jgi:uncharacterized protein (DUF4415 family)
MKSKYDFSEAKRGAVVVVPKAKEKITMHLDRDVLNWFRHEVDRAGGGNYQSATAPRRSFEITQLSIAD